MPPSDQPPTETPLPAVKPPPSFEAGGKLQAMIPRTIEDAWRLAQYLAQSELTPKDMRRPAQVMAAILQGLEVGLPPIQAVQSIAVINGRPVMWGDGLLALVLARQVKVEEWMEGEGDSRIAYCKVTRPDTGQVIERWFSVEDAKEAGLWNKKGANGQDTPWVTYKRRMLQMRARSWAIRDGCADITRGMWVREEAQDIPPERITNPDAPAPTTPAQLADDVAADPEAKFEIVQDAEFTEGPPVNPDKIREESAPESAPPENEGSAPKTSDEKDEVVGLTDVPPEASALSPSKRWVAQVRAAFAAAKTPVDFDTLAVRWASDLNTRALVELRAEDPGEAEALEREYEALEKALKPKTNGRRK